MARRRLELLSAELAEIRPDPVETPEPRVDRAGPASHPTAGRSARPTVDGHGAGRHAHRPVGRAGRGRRLDPDRLPPTLQGRVRLTAAHLAVRRAAGRRRAGGHRLVAARAGGDDATALPPVVRDPVRAGHGRRSVRRPSLAPSPAPQRGATGAGQRQHRRRRRRQGAPSRHRDAARSGPGSSTRWRPRAVRARASRLGAPEPGPGAGRRRADPRRGARAAAASPPRPPRRRPVRGGSGGPDGEHQQRDAGRARGAARGRAGDGAEDPGLPHRATAPSPRSTSCSRSPGSATPRSPRWRPSSRSDAGAAAGRRTRDVAAGPARRRARRRRPGPVGWPLWACRAGPGSCVALLGSTWLLSRRRRRRPVATLLACLVAASAVGGRDRCCGSRPTSAARSPRSPSRARPSTVTARVTSDPVVRTGRFGSFTLTRVSRARRSSAAASGTGRACRCWSSATRAGPACSSGSTVTVDGPARATRRPRPRRRCSRRVVPPRVLERPGELLAGAARVRAGIRASVAGRGPGRTRPGARARGGRRPGDVRAGRRGLPHLRADPPRGRLRHQPHAGRRVPARRRALGGGAGPRSGRGRVCSAWPGSCCWPDPSPASCGRRRWARWRCSGWAPAAGTPGVRALGVAVLVLLLARPVAGAGRSASRSPRWPRRGSSSSAPPFRDALLRLAAPLGRGGARGPVRRPAGLHAGRRGDLRPGQPGGRGRQPRGRGGRRPGDRPGLLGGLVDAGARPRREWSAAGWPGWCAGWIITVATAPRAAAHGGRSTGRPGCCRVAGAGVRSAWWSGWAPRRCCAGRGGRCRCAWCSSW